MVRDEIIVFEVLTETLDEPWWTSCRRRLEADFQQDKIIVRASVVTLLEGRRPEARPKLMGRKERAPPGLRARPRAEIF